MTSLTRNVWGREFDLDVTFEDWDGEGVLDSQWASYGSIIMSWQAIEDALPKLEDYCLELDKDMIGEAHIDNIFRFVIPKSLFISREEARQVVALMCDYRFDPDNGIAVVFVNGKLAEIGTQDIVL